MSEGFTWLQWILLNFHFYLSLTKNKQAYLILICFKINDTSTKLFWGCNKSHLFHWYWRKPFFDKSFYGFWKYIRGEFSGTSARPGGNNEVWMPSGCREVTDVTWAVSATWGDCLALLLPLKQKLCGDLIRESPRACLGVLAKSLSTHVKETEEKFDLQLKKALRSYKSYCNIWHNFIVIFICCLDLYCKLLEWSRNFLFCIFNMQRSVATGIPCHDMN